MPYNSMPGIQGTSSKSLESHGSEVTQWTNNFTPFSAINVSSDTLMNATALAPLFLPSVNDNMLRTSEADHPPSAAMASIPAAAGTAAANVVVVPAAGLPLSERPDLVERSAFLYGLLHSDSLVYNVRDAIAMVAAAATAAPTTDIDDDSNDKRRHARGDISRGSALCGVFYFPAQPPWKDMPWRPAYKSAVLLCIFATASACQQAVARLNETTMPVRSGSDLVASPSVAMSSSPGAPPTGVSSARVVLRRASECVLSAASVDMALLTFLTAPQLADLLVRRRRMQVLSERGAADGADGEKVEDMLAFVRANPPSSRLRSSAVRLYAAILSQQSPYHVDWAAAQVAVNRGDGVVVPEMAVIEPWVGGGGSRLDDRSMALRDYDRRSGSRNDGGSGDATALGRGGVDGTRRADGRSGWDSRSGSLPLTLQEEDYRKRYGLALKGAGLSNAVAGGNDGDRQDSGDGFAGLMPSRSALYLGARQVLRGASWLLRRLRDGLVEEEAPLLSGSGGSSRSSAALPIMPPAFTRGASSSSSSAVVAAASAIHGEQRGIDEPPRRRHRPEGRVDTAGDRSYGETLVIPRYNAVGTALSWMPGFQYFGRFFVTSTTVLQPQGAAPHANTRQRSQRRRQREEEASTACDNPAWESLVVRRYTDAAAEQTRPSSQPHSEHPAPVRDTVLAWMSPARGTGWPAPLPWPAEEAMAPTPLPGGHSAGLSWKAARVTEPLIERPTAQADFSALGSLTGSTIATKATAAQRLCQPSPTLCPTLNTVGCEAPTMLGRAGRSRRYRTIRVEGVHTPLNDNGDTDGSSFLSHHFRRRAEAEPKPENVSAEEASRVSRNRESFGEELHKHTQDAREAEDGSSPPRTPMDPSQRVPGIAGLNASGPATYTTGRSSQRTVSFTFPDEKS